MDYWDKVFKEIYWSCNMGFAETSYAVGNIVQIRDGSLFRQRLAGEIDFSRLDSLRQTGGNVVGVYQKTWPRKPKSPAEAGLYSREILKTTDAGIRAIFGIRDAVDSGLVMVGYNPNFLSERDLREELNDGFERVAVHPITSMPIIQDKDLSKVQEFISRSIPDKRAYETIESQIAASMVLCVQLTPEVTHFMIEETKQYGMNRIDWFSLMTILDQAGVL